jgi:hypothetical protein
MILDDLLREAAATQSLAMTLAENAQPAAPISAEAETLPRGASRDKLAGRLLEIAAALDDALELAAQPSPDTHALSGTLSRLRAEIEFARRALPEVEAARRGSPGADAQDGLPGHVAQRRPDRGQ